MFFPLLYVFKKPIRPFNERLSDLLWKQEPAGVLVLTPNFSFQMRMNARVNLVSMPTPAGIWLAATTVIAWQAGLARIVR